MRFLKLAVLILLAGFAVGSTPKAGVPQRLLVRTDYVSVPKADQPVLFFSKAIADAEGFRKPNAIPTRYHNPGDIKFTVGYRYPGQIGIGKGGHVIFKNDAAGWAALNHQVHKMLDGTSRHYRLDMTLNQVGRNYAENWRVWANHVAKDLHCSPKLTLREIFDIPPRCYTNDARVPY